MFLRAPGATTSMGEPHGHLPWLPVLRCTPGKPGITPTSRAAILRVPVRGGRGPGVIRVAGRSRPVPARPPAGNAVRIQTLSLLVAGPRGSHEDAVAALRSTIGATDPAEAAAGTVRKLYAESKERNAIHASDSDDNATRESGFFFAETELIRAK